MTTNMYRVGGEMKKNFFSIFSLLSFVLCFVESFVGLSFFIFTLVLHSFYSCILLLFLFYYFITSLPLCFSLFLMTLNWTLKFCRRNIWGPPFLLLVCCCSVLMWCKIFLVAAAAYYETPVYFVCAKKKNWRNITQT